LYLKNTFVYLHHQISTTMKNQVKQGKKGESVKLQTPKVSAKEQIKKALKEISKGVFLF
jgi:hypothetical protein